MYLVGCHLSEDPALLTLEGHYLTRTRQVLASSLGDLSGSLLQWLQASCLLTYYLLRKCRFLEARQEVSIDPLRLHHYAQVCSFAYLTSLVHRWQARFSLSSLPDYTRSDHRIGISTPPMRPLTRCSHLRRTTSSWARGSVCSGWSVLFFHGVL